LTSLSELTITINSKYKKNKKKGAIGSLGKKAGHIPGRQKIDNIISMNQGKPGSLLAILEQVQGQNKHNYLPEETLYYISDTLHIPRSQVFSVVTFYSFFNLTPQGKHTVTICRGTACHAQGSKKILSVVSSYFGLSLQEIEEGTPVTTPDYFFTVKTVACFGQCAVAPVIEIDNNMYNNVTEEQLKIILEEIKK